MLEMPGMLVSKSYVPGKGFVPASQLGTRKLRKVVKPGQYKSRGLDRGQRTALEAHQGNTAMFRAIADDPTTKTRRTRTGTQRMRMEDLTSQTGLQGAAWKHGGRQGKKVYAEDADLGDYGRKVKGFVRTHEEAHVAPKSRTSWRLANISSNSRKSMREEARADMAAGQSYRTVRRDFRRARPVHQAARGGDYDALERVLASNPRAASAADRVSNSSGYASAAASRQMSREKSGAFRAVGMKLQAEKFGPTGTKAYRETQDKIARGQLRRRER